MECLQDLTRNLRETSKVRQNIVSRSLELFDEKLVIIKERIS